MITIRQDITQYHSYATRKVKDIIFKNKTNNERGN